MATDLLALGVSVVFDFGANTVADRAWVRSVFERAGAEHARHVLDVDIDDDECRRRVRARTVEKPEGRYFGDVSDELIARVLPHIAPTHPPEGLRLVRHDGRGGCHLTVATRCAGLAVTSACA